MDNIESGNGEKKKKFVEPTLHFITKNIVIGEDDMSDPIPVAELVKSQQLLADFPDFHRLASRGFEKLPLEPGDYAELGEDQESILASVPGYPKVRKVRRKDQPNLITVVSIEPLLHISPDNMQVTLALHPPLEDGKSLQNTSLDEVIAEQNIIFGLIPEAIAKAKKIISQGDREFNKIIIARGQQVGQSTDAYLRFDMEVGPIAGTILKDGSIDFRERRVMVGVTQGQLIATKVPAKQGEPGINVFGKETPAREGKDLKVSILNDARYSPETFQVTATKDGVLSVINNNVIKVCSHQVINSDIDFETGNIDSMNSITVHGSVQPGFRLSTAGDLKIVGSVVSAKLTCGGNLVVGGGITGKNSGIQVEGDADVHFIEQASLTCGGIVVIRKQSYYSNVISGADIRCKYASILMGGRIVAAGNITIGDVGSLNSAPSLIAAGVLGERLTHLQELKNSVVEQQEAIVQWLQLYRGSGRSKKVRGMEKELADTKLRLLRVNLIPGTGKYSRVAGQDSDDILQGEDYDSTGGIAIENIKIDVHGTIFAGTEVRIGNRTLKLEKTVSNRQFKLHPNGKRIIAGPIRK